ncbi:MAG: MFS transporter [Chloroflexi bacterium]|nr:MFS transporter [Chloroflexota bacterium]
MLARLAHLRQRVYYGWWIVAAGSAAMFAGGGLHSYGFSVFFLPLSHDLGLTRASTSLVFAAARLEGGLEAPISGRLVDRLGPRMMLLTGATLAGLGYILLGLFARNFWSFFLIYVLVLSTGFSAGFFSAILVAFNTWFRRNRGTAIGILGASHRSGAFLLVPILSVLVLSLGWQKAAVIEGLFILAVAVPVAFVFRHSPESMGLSPDGTPSEARESSAQARPGREGGSSAPEHDFTVAEALRTPAFWILTLAQGVRMAALGAVLVHAVPILVWKGVGQQEAANILGVMALIGAIGILVMGWIADLLSKRAIASLGVFSGGVGLLVLAGASQTWHLYIFIALYAFSEMTHPAMIALVGDFFGRKSFGTVRGVSQFFSTFASFGMPVYAGWVWDTTGSYTGALIPFAIAAGIAAVLYLVVRPPKAPVETLIRAKAASG